MIFFFFVNPLASRMAVIVASDPVFTRRIFFMDGKFFCVNLASSTSSSVGAQYSVPTFSCLETAEITSFLLCPSSKAPYPLQKSMYLLPSSSQIRLPFDFFTKNGYGSKYLTGLFTPEGIIFFASRNSCFDFFNAKSDLWLLLFVISCKSLVYLTIFL